AELIELGSADDNSSTALDRQAVRLEAAEMKQAFEIRFPGAAEGRVQPPVGVVSPHGVAADGDDLAVLEIDLADGSAFSRPDGDAIAAAEVGVLVQPSIA